MVVVVVVAKESCDEVVRAEGEEASLFLYDVSFYRWFRRGCEADLGVV